jgi:hydrogenase nickel incorporation protein HypB
MQTSKIQIVENILSANDRIAEENRQYLDSLGVKCLNIMASPGAGKTSVILKTIKSLTTEIKIAVIEGDTAPVTIDADKVSLLNVPVTQINTGGNCHLDAMMVQKGIQHLHLRDVGLLIIENVGNLVCPATFRLGEHINLVIASVPEGDDKPYKYPGIYQGIDALILNKSDLLPYVEFNQDYFRQGIEALNPGIPQFLLSSKTGEGFSAWTSWLLGQLSKS